MKCVELCSQSLIFVSWTCYVRLLSFILDSERRVKETIQLKRSLQTHNGINFHINNSLIHSLNQMNWLRCNWKVYLFMCSCCIYGYILFLQASFKRSWLKQTSDSLRWCHFISTRLEEDSIHWEQHMSPAEPGLGSRIAFQVRTFQEQSLSVDKSDRPHTCKKQCWWRELGINLRDLHPCKLYNPSQTTRTELVIIHVHADHASAWYFFFFIHSWLLLFPLTDFDAVFKYAFYWYQSKSTHNHRREDGLVCYPWCWKQNTDYYLVSCRPSYLLYSGGTLKYL